MLTYAQCPTATIMRKILPAYYVET